VAVAAPHAVQKLAPTTKLVPQLLHFAAKLMAVRLCLPPQRCAEPVQAMAAAIGGVSTTGP
jgi:hypothetical protein